MKWSEVKSLSRVQLFATPWTVACQAPLSMGFSRQEYWSGLPSLLQYLTKYSSTVQQLAFRGWHRVTAWRRERGREMVDLKIISNRKHRADYSFIHAWHWWHMFWFLDGLNSIYTLEKMIQWCLGSSSFFLIIGDTVALDCILNGYYNLPVLFSVQVLFLIN